jgi:hypothetical protein
MNLETIFSVCNSFALAGWIVLIFLPFWKKRDQYVLGIIILLLAAAYSWIIFWTMNRDTIDNFSTLAGVARLFADDTVLLAGWIHYLAFDLLAGIYVVRNAVKNGINHWLTTPALFFAFLLGPFGLLLYVVLRWAKTRKFLTDF